MLNTATATVNVSFMTCDDEDAENNRGIAKQEARSKKKYEKQTLNRRQMKKIADVVQTWNVVVDSFVDAGVTPNVDDDIEDC